MKLFNSRVCDLCGGEPELIMFDLDGTLVDSVPDLAAALDAMAAAHGVVALGEELTRVWVGNGAGMLVERAMQHCLQVSEVDGALHKLWLDSFLEFYGQASGRYAKLYPGVREALECIAQTSIAQTLVTNKPVQFVPELLSSLQIEEYFSVWLGGDSLPEKKPDPQPLQYLLECHQVVPGRALMIGDSRSDIQAARSAGVAVVAVSYGYNHGRPVQREAPDLVVDSLLELF